MDIFDKIRGWAEARNLIEGSKPDVQFVKLVEEANELARAIITDDDAEFIDAIGDCVVVLTIMARQKGYLIEDCIGSAWLEIKDRKGKMVDGIFVKDEA
jgi:NTP pyrophosphatase (non-canonical NTP hydrolase)